MNIKRGIVTQGTGLAIELIVLWCIDHYTHLNLFQRIVWTSFFVWGCLIAGFLTAHWLIFWSKFSDKIYKLFRKKEQTPEPTEEPPAPPTAPVVTQNRAMMPTRMNVQNKAVLSVDPNSAAAAANTAPATNNLSAAPAAPAKPEPSQKEKDIEMLCGLEPDLDMMAFKHVNLEGKNIDLVYSSDTNALLCNVFSEEHTWTVNTSTSIEESAWTDENGQEVRPCLLLLRQAAALEKMEPDSTLCPTILLMRGTIQNAEEAIPYLKEHQITVATYQPSNMPDVKTLQELLVSNFTPFPPSYDVVTDAFNQNESETKEDNENPETEETKEEKFDSSESDEAMDTTDESEPNDIDQNTSLEESDLTETNEEPQVDETVQNDLTEEDKPIVTGDDANV